MATKLKTLRDAPAQREHGIGIRPSSDQCIIEYLPLETKSPGGILYPGNAKELDPNQRRWDQSYRAIVLAVGPGRRKENRHGMTISAELVPMTLKVGDIIACRQQNFPFQRDGRTCYWIRERDVDGVY